MCVYRGFILCLEYAACAWRSMQSSTLLRYLYAVHGYE
jgi:hypothetical protein